MYFDHQLTSLRFCLELLRSSDEARFRDAAERLDRLLGDHMHPDLAGVWSGPGPGENDLQTAALILGKLEPPGNDTRLQNPIVSAKDHLLSFSVLDSPKSLLSVPNADLDGVSGLIDDFQERLRDLDTWLDAKPRLWLEQLWASLDSSLWTLPLKVEGRSPTSLVQAARTLAALRICRAETDGKNPGFRLVGGDLSGIQDFIFDLREAKLRKLSKTLRARSMYLEVLSEVSARLVLEKLDLPSVNMLESAGGRYLLLVPETEDTEDILRSMVETQQEWCTREYLAEIRIHLAWTDPFESGQLAPDHFPDALSKLGQIIESAKLQYNLATLGTPDLHRFDLDYDAKQGACNVCGKYPGRYPDGDTWRCQHCQDMSVLGGSIARREGYLVVEQNPDKANLPGDLYLSARKELPVSKETFSAYNLAESPLSKHVPRAGSEDTQWFKELPGAASERFDDPRELHLRPGDPLTFSHLALGRENVRIETDGMRGEDFLFVFKADVDNLAKLFREGLGSNFSLLERNGLSFLFNGFFTRSLRSWLAEHPRYRSIYTVFAGGDDLILIGPWGCLLDFARDFQHFFISFSGGGATISAGVQLAKPRWDMRRVIRSAEAGLEAAKNGGRDRIHIFEETFVWDVFVNAMTWREQLDRVLAENSYRPPSAWWYKLLYFAREAAASAEEPSRLIYRGRFNYHIERQFNREQLTPWRDFMLALLKPTHEEELIHSQLAIVEKIYASRRTHE